MLRKQRGIAASRLSARLFAAIRPAKARTAAKFEVFALLAFATAANAITFVSAEGRATGCRSLMQAGADLSENQHIPACIFKVRLRGLVHEVSPRKRAVVTAA